MLLYSLLNEMQKNSYHSLLNTMQKYISHHFDLLTEVKNICKSGTTRVPDGRLIEGDSYRNLQAINSKGFCNPLLIFSGEKKITFR